MAKDLLTSAHVNIFRNSTGGVFLPSEIISEVQFSAPAFHGYDIRGVSIPTATKSFHGQKYDALFKVKTGDAEIFRDYNQGVSTSKDGYEPRTFYTKQAGGYAAMDAALMKGNDAAGLMAWEQTKKDMLDMVIRELERQFFYGNPKPGKDGNIANGFAGLQNFVHDDMVYDAGGTGTNLASAYFIYFHQHRGVSWLMGEDGTMNFTEPFRESEMDGKGKPYEAIKTYFNFWPGLACHGKYTVLRIANIDTTTADTVDKDRGVITDEKIMTALTKWEIGAPNACITTKKVATLLGASRKASMIDVATNNEIIVSAGQTQIARDCDGGNIPLAISDALSNNEKKWTA